MITAIFVLLVLIALNSFFVIAEISLILSKTTKLKELEKTHPASAKITFELLKYPDDFLATVQVGVTIMNIIIGLVAGDAISKHMQELLSFLPLANEPPEYISYFIAVIIMTYFTVILGEILPKRIAMSNPERSSLFVAYGMFTFSKLVFPLIYILSISTKVIIKALGINTARDNVSIDELKLAVNQAESSGVLDETERDMLKRLMNLGNTKVSAIMTPRKQLAYIDLQESDEQNVNKLHISPFNYFPVINGDLNSIEGLVSVKNLFSCKRINNNVLREYAQKNNLLYVPELASVTKLLQLFRQRTARIAIVLDEYGETEGIVTLNDILKTFLGDFASLIQGRENYIIQKDAGNYIAHGSLLIEEIKDLTGLDALTSHDDNQGYSTLAGLVFNKLNHLPKVGDSFTINDWLFRVVKMDGFRIEKVSIQKQTLEE